MLNENEHQGSVAKTSQRIREVYRFFADLRERSQQIDIKMMKGCLPHQLLILNDERAVVVPYLYSNATFRSPLFDVGSAADLYTVFASEFEALWNASETASAGKAEPAAGGDD